MCGLCGLLGVVHWTETSAHPDAFTGGPARTIRAERARRVAAVNAALAPMGMRLRDFQATSYVLSSATGRSAVVDDVQAVWSAVERIAGRPLDPLDPGWIERLGAGRR